MHRFPLISLQQCKNSKNITHTHTHLACFPDGLRFGSHAEPAEENVASEEISGIPAPIYSIRCYSFSEGLSCAHFSIWKVSVLLVLILILRHWTFPSVMIESMSWRGKPASTLRVWPLMLAVTKVPAIYVERCPGREKYEGGSRRECHRIFGQQSKILWHNSTQTHSQPINTAAWISKSTLTAPY